MSGAKAALERSPWRGNIARANILAVMARKAAQQPLVSVTLPLAPDADPHLLEICLRSLSAQTYPNFEVLILVSDGSPPELLRMARDFPSARLYEGSFNKSEARNLLLANSRGRYHLYLDVDNELPETLLQTCVERALETGAQAIIAPNREAPSDSFWRRCRTLEWELLAGDLAADTPNFLTKALLEELGGWDPGLDPLDDWQLNLALRSRGTPSERAESFILVHSTSSLREMVHRKYVRGRLVTALEAKYPNVPQLRFARRFERAYLRNWPLLIRSPILALGLAFLKVLDMAALYWGRLHPLKEGSGDGAGAYLQPEVARTYDAQRLGDNFNRYKHYAEIRSLSDLLRQPRGALLEVGCGTGRVTGELVERGFRILPLDPSPAMLGQLVGKRTLPGPIRADGTALPFADDSFDGAYSLRVLWHLPTAQDARQMLKEMARVAARNVILDVANEQRWKHPLIRIVAGVFYALRPAELQSHRSSLLLTLHDFSVFAQECGLRLEHSVPLDVLSPIWLNLLPQRAASAIFPVVRRLELILWKVIPPGRFLVLLEEGSVHDTNS